MNTKNQTIQFPPVDTLFEALAESVAEKVFCRIVHHLETRLENNQGDPWITLAEAKKILGYESKKKWKELRDTGQIDFAQIGRPFKYYKPSLIKFLEKNSTLKSNKKNGKPKL